MKNKDIFKKLVYLEGGSKKWQIASAKSVDSERWLQHIMPADAEAPNIELDRKYEPFLVIIGISFLLLTILAGRLFSMQAVNGKNSLQKAQNNYVRDIPIRAPRGIIFDTKGKPLVKNVPNYDLSVTPSDLPLDPEKREVTLKEISDISKNPIDELKKKISEIGEHSTQPVLLAKNLTKDQSILFESRIANLPGVLIEVNPIREYLDSGLLSQVFGYVSRISGEELKKVSGDYLLTDYIGKSGLEKEYESKLRGKMGSDQYEVDASGKVKNVLGRIDPIPGNGLKLSVDFELQQHMADALKTQMTKANVQRATAVAINPKNGQVLGMVNLPTYDNNLFANGISTANYQKLLDDENTPLLNRATSGEYPSGSTIKPFVAAAALEEGNITESTTVSSTGGIKIGDFTFPDWKGGGHGATNVLKAIAESVNTFFYTIGGGYGDIKGLGPDLIKKYLLKFGFNTYTGIDIGGEARGSIPDPDWKLRLFNEPWYLGDTYHMAIGQGDVLVTPLQMANATAAIANGGTIYEPTLLKEVLDAEGKVIETKQPKVIGKTMVSAKTMDIVDRGMRQTVTAGSGRVLQDIPVEMYAKTGTAQYGPNNSKSHAWFICYSKDPKNPIAMAILIEGAGGGDVFAAPAANDVLKWYYSNR
jgi:penicillin-binding protein 2